MASTISVRLDEALLKDLMQVEKKWQTDRSESVRRLLVSAVLEWKIDNALAQLKEHKISIGKAAKNCSMSLWEMLSLAKKNDINWTSYNQEDLEKDLEHIK